MGAGLILIGIGVFWGVTIGALVGYWLAEADAETTVREQLVYLPPPRPAQHRQDA